MNFLAHLWLADVTRTSSAGAILGDVAHGRIAGLHLSPELALGVRIHRRVDVVTDHHALSLKWRGQFPDRLRRYSGITLDLLCDHMLAADWPEYSNMALAEFSAAAGDALAAQADCFQRLGTWRPEAKPFARLLCSYAEWSGFEYALQRTAARLSKPQPLLDSAHYARAVVPDIRAELPQLLRDLEAAAMAVRDDNPTQVSG